jgi:hypothetical protein
MTEAGPDDIGPDGTVRLLSSRSTLFHSVAV